MSKDGFAVQVHIPRFVIVIANEKDTVESGCKTVAAAVKSRLARGVGSRGSLPRGRGNNKPLVQTGQFLDSVGYVIHPVRRRGQATGYRGVVRAMGARNDLGVKTKVRRAAQKTKHLRATVVLGAALSSLSGAGNSSRLTGNALKKRIRKTRVRTANTNAALAGILSQPPRDKSAKSGNRGLYRVYEVTERYTSLGYKAMKKTVVYTAKQVDTIILKR